MKRIFERAMKKLIKESTNNLVKKIECFLVLLIVIVAQVNVVSAADVKDGDYSCELTFEGGTGKAYIESPCNVKVEDGKLVATFVWSSTHYDYMIVDGEKYLNENPGGQSTFTVPVPAFDQEFDVIGDTTAMSTPHEIEYKLVVKAPASNDSKKNNNMVMWIGLFASALFILAVGLVINYKNSKMKKSDGSESKEKP